MTTGSMSGEDGEENRKVQEWLLLLLRFAITRHPSDRAAAVAMSAEMDSIGRERPATPRFFSRSALEVCLAIEENTGDNDAVLRKHIARIANPRLARAFRAAIQADRVKSERSNRKSQDLWRGLAQR